HDRRSVSVHGRAVDGRRPPRSGTVSARDRASRAHDGAAGSGARRRRLFRRVRRREQGGNTMSLWKKLFGGGETAREEPAAEPVEHKGFLIRPTPFVEDGQYQTCGVITRVVDGETKEHRFVRADRF